MLALLFASMSCTLDKTDYESEIDTEVKEHLEFEEVISINKDGYKIHLEALNGTLYKGYNEIRLKLTDTQTNESLSTSEVTFLPIITKADATHASGPHKYLLEYNPMESYYKGYAVFTDESGDLGTWDLHISFTTANEVHKLEEKVTVEKQTNKNLNMTAFTGNDNEQYYIALIAPQKPRIAENELVAGIYKYNQPDNPTGSFPDSSQFSYAEVNSHTLLLDPRMPEPSMGNHSSINNKDLVQKSDGLYYGVVNYTMTGNWTLNFILLNEQEEIIKGTEVSTDFTPGIEGEKSELYIDILF